MTQVRRIRLRHPGRQVEAIDRYEKLGYAAIPQFGLHAPAPFFPATEKTLVPA